MQQEDDKILEEKDLDAATILEINKYKEIIVKKINSYIQYLPSESLLEDPNSHRLFKIESSKHHLYKINFTHDTTLESVVLSAEEGAEAIELNRPGKARDEYLGLVDSNSFGGSANISVNPVRIRILGSFQSFKIRMDEIANEIINARPFTEGN